MLHSGNDVNRTTDMVTMKQTDDIALAAILKLIISNYVRMKILQCAVENNLSTN